MNNSKTIKKTTPKQFEALVDFMCQNPNIAKGYHKNTDKLSIKEQWNNLQRKLNSLGPPTREAEGWMKVWADMKSSVKKKIVHNKMESRATGGGIFNQKLLTPLEEAVAGLLQINSIVSPECPSIGVQSSPVNLIQEILEDEVDGHVSEDNVEVDIQPNTSTRKRKQRTVDKNVLLDQQLKIQTSLYEEVKKSLSEIERYSRKNYKVQEERLKMEKEKLRLYKEQIRNKENYRTNILKLRTEEITLKQQKIEIEKARIQEFL
ncbi:uncharacterized protein LOC131995955 [Stomoxys calcitrans]|uniref:uncharacterized protein LOC131995265 n=1 Tax=Stomoxys calcitrans TaxID=35570 RepID=UPI0027E319C8|nr:uncharacterized protein LOC131995265 [Stomoxys calcitrans]XP_059221285.1 uncharacterized protein LOC131995955 [Stomoxys calcitrans]